MEMRVMTVEIASISFGRSVVSVVSVVNEFFFQVGP